MDKILEHWETERIRRGLYIPEVSRDNFNLYFYFASLVMLFIKVTDITQIGWQGVFAPMIFLGLFKFFGKA